MWHRMRTLSVNNIWSLTLKYIDFKWIQEVHWMNEKPSANRAYVPAPIEHVANVITHGVWVFPSVMGCLMLIQRASTWPEYWSAVIYGAALVLLFTISTVFHSVFYYCHNSPLKDILHRGDRAMIYIFIAASYFPWLTLTPIPPGGWAAELRWIVWVLASLGILYQQMYHEQYKCLETLFYLFIGITPAFAIIGMNEFSGLRELKLGGVIYIFGVFFFKSDGKIPFAHAIWHLFVVLAAAVHYYAIFNYLYHNNQIDIRK